MPFTEAIPSNDVVSLEDRPHQIGELAEKFGITLRTIRFYEERGLIAPRRISARTRLYDIDDVARLSLIVALRRYGVSVDAIADLLTTRDTKGTDAFLPMLAAVLITRLSEMATEIDEARRLHAGLDAWIADLNIAS